MNDVDYLLYALIPVFVLPHAFRRPLRGRSWLFWTVLLLVSNLLLVFLPLSSGDARSLALVAALFVVTAATTVIARTVPQSYLAGTLTFVVNGIVTVAVFGNPFWLNEWNAAVSAAVHSIALSSVLTRNVSEANMHAFLVYLLGIWIATVEVNGPIALFLKTTRLMPQPPSKFSAAPPAGSEKAPEPVGGTPPGGGDASDVVGEPARGRVIGIMERGIVFVLVLTNNLSALGLVLAAKGFARFRQLDDRDFAEYVLIGTLLSIASALVVGLCMKAVL